MLKEEANEKNWRKPNGMDELCAVFEDEGVCLRIVSSLDVIIN